MQQRLTVALPTGEVVSCTTIATSCPLEIGRVVMESNFILFNLLEFDIILGIDWLFRDYVSINYRQQTVIFLMPREEEGKKL